jgi:hypothetical protein
MTVTSALANRYAMWHAVLCEDYGYEETQPVRPPGSAYELALRAVRPAWPPVQAVVFDVRETWLPGADPELGLTLHGCFLAISGWHAQVLATVSPTTSACPRRRSSIPMRGSCTSRSSSRRPSHYGYLQD